MTYAPRARVTVCSANQERRALVLAKVSGVAAYAIRYSDGTRATVHASQLRSPEAPQLRPNTQTG